MDGQQYVLTTSEDITERKRAEQERERLLAEVKAQRTLLDTVIEQLPVGIGIAEAPSGQLLRINEQTRRIWRMDSLEANDTEGYGKYVGIHPDGRQYCSRTGNWCVPCEGK